ncbi:hypothetical protein [Streptomyces sp. ICN441]|uniref:hypothetical protein n=1 Tax=Streptomyces sp. ICN441 TaxID=2558286 RepID=UPI00141AF352|nr:hypothetical protein [Streptomyces sp. ICN441]
MSYVEPVWYSEPASYFEHGGGVTGIGVAASESDPVALRAAKAAVAEWSGVLRTRRALLADADRCCVTAGRGLCPLARQAVTELVDRSRGQSDVLLLCRPGLPAGRLGSAALTRVSSVDEARTVQAGDAENVYFVVDPGIRIEVAAAMVKVLRQRFPRLRGQHPRHWCYSESDWARCVRTLTDDCDRVLVLGGADDTFVEFASQENSRLAYIRDSEEVRPSWLADAATVGIVIAPPATGETVRRLLDVLSGLGPLDVVHRRFTSEHLSRARIDALWPAEGQSPPAPPALPRMAWPLPDSSSTAPPAPAPAP